MSDKLQKPKPEEVVQLNLRYKDLEDCILNHISLLSECEQIALEEEYLDTAKDLYEIRLKLEYLLVEFYTATEISDSNIKSAYASLGYKREEPHE